MTPTMAEIGDTRNPLERSSSEVTHGGGTTATFNIRVP